MRRFAERSTSRRDDERAVRNDGSGYGVRAAMKPKKEKGR